MIKGFAASKAAKALGLCVCPVVGTGVVATQVPAVRTAVHKATAPRAYAKPKTRVRVASAAPVKMAALADAPCVSGAPVVVQNGEVFNLPNLPQSGQILALGNSPLGPLTNIPASYNPPSRPVFFDPPATPIIPVNPPAPGEPGGNPGDPGTPVNPLPEPATWAQLLLGFMIVGGVMRSTSRGRRNEEAKAAV